MYAQSISFGIVKDLKETFSPIYDKLNKTYSVQNKSYLELFKLLRTKKDFPIQASVYIYVHCMFMCVLKVMLKLDQLFTENDV